MADFSRRGFFDGIGIRLPTICVRPGKPNKAASGFFSGIIREPLKGEPAILPVTDDVRHWFASPRAAVNFLFHAGALELGQLGSRRTLNMPGLSATVGEMIASLEKVAGAECVKLIQREPDPRIQRIVDGWAQRLDASRAQALGFRAETSFREIIKTHVEDECGGELPCCAIGTPLPSIADHVNWQRCQTGSATTFRLMGLCRSLRCFMDRTDQAWWRALQAGFSSRAATFYTLTSTATRKRTFFSSGLNGRNRAAERRFPG